MAKATAIIPEPDTNQQSRYKQRIKAVIRKIIEMSEKERRADILLL